MHPLTFVIAEIQGVYKGYFAASIRFFCYYAYFLVFGYTEYKGKQKEIFDAAINGM